LPRVSLAAKRVRELSRRIAESGIRALVLLNQSNVKYSLGLGVDYSAVLVTEAGEAYAISHVLEGGRVREVRHVSDVILYSSYPLPAKEVQVVGSLSAAVAATVEKFVEPPGPIGYEGYHLPVSSFKELEGRLGKYSFVDASNCIWGARAVKMSDEIERIRGSALALSRAMASAVDSLSEGVREEDVAKVFVRAITDEGCFVTASPIVASGWRAALPHGRATEKVVARGEPVVLDFVCSCRDYCSDMTRTVSVGELPEWLREIHRLVKEAQERALDAVRPGVRACDVDGAARELIREAGFGDYFIHSTGHGIGLEVHEPPRIAPKVETPLEEGAVVTIEPGIYLPGRGGVRIEDTVLVSPRGAEVLTPYTKELLVL